MAKARAIVKRRNAVRNIRKITQTMQLIATARFARCAQRATAGKPYTEKITEMIETLSGSAALDHPLLTPNTGTQESILLVMTSNRGFCGSYNANILRKILDYRREQVAAGFTPSLELIGKKGTRYLRFLKIPVASSIIDVEDKIEYARVAEMAERYMKAYEAGKIARVDVAYTRFVSTAVQTPMIAQLLPIEPPKADESAQAQRGEQQVLFEFSPEPAKLLARLIPETVKIRLYQYFNDAIVSEQVSRMVAMKAATDAAGDMIKSLTREYNRARQSQITLELADIVGGAAAVE